MSGKLAIIVSSYQFTSYAVTISTPLLDIYDFFCFYIMALSLILSRTARVLVLVLTGNTWSPEAPAAAACLTTPSQRLFVHMHSRHMGLPVYTCISRCSAMNARPLAAQAAWQALCLIWQ